MNKSAALSGSDTNFPQALENFYHFNLHAVGGRHGPSVAFDHYNSALLPLSSLYNNLKVLPYSIISLVPLGQMAYVLLSTTTEATRQI